MMNPIWQRARLALALLALIALSVSGFWGVTRNGVSRDWPEKFSTFMQTAYAVLGLAVVLLLLKWPRWARAMLYLWALTWCSRRTHHHLGGTGRCRGLRSCLMRWWQAW